ncbi:MAG: TrkH family potassium uptake protein [Acidobacteria bacterium]|nr:MAG: TrkH family potassium uptake protein [Acidobacteriota bacterium]
MSIRPVLRFVGRLLLILAVAVTLPAVVAAIYGEWDAAGAFLSTALATGACGAVLALLGRGGGHLYRREGILIVVGGWALASLFGALPYLLTGTVSSPIDALFESASGFTTTGASILTDIEAAGRGILFWRSFTQWLGGMGIIVLFVALLPELGAGARFVYKLEVPGPTKETLHPRVRDTAAVLWRTYMLLTGAQVALLLLCGLDLYDATTHAFSTLSTGGFSPRAASAGAFSPLAQAVIIVFMVLAGINFSLYYRFLRHRGRRLWQDPEWRIYVTLILIFGLWVAGDLWVNGAYDGHGAGRALLDAVFQVVSILTTTGFATADFDRWPTLARGLLVALMFIGGCAGSTAGGLKIIRMVIGLKAALREARLIFSPSAVIAIFVGGKAVPESVVRSVMGIFILYFSTWGLATLLLTIGDFGLRTSATAAIVTLGNIGPGLEGVGPTQSFALFAGWQKLLMVLLMWLGRLEVYSIAALFTLAFWRR